MAEARGTHTHLPHTHTHTHTPLIEEVERLRGLSNLVYLAVWASDERVVGWVLVRCVCGLKEECRDVSGDECMKRTGWAFSK